MEQLAETAEQAERPQINTAKSERPSLLAKLQKPLPTNQVTETKKNEMEVL